MEGPIALEVLRLISDHPSLILLETKDAAKSTGSRTEREQDVGGRGVGREG
jgi:hypothetical protein